MIFSRNTLDVIIAFILVGFCLFISCNTSTKKSENKLEVGQIGINDNNPISEDYLFLKKVEILKLDTFISVQKKFKVLNSKNTKFSHSIVYDSIEKHYKIFGIDSLDGNYNLIFYGQEYVRFDGVIFKNEKLWSNVSLHFSNKD